jgi:hypothetical protein
MGLMRLRGFLLLLVGLVVLGAPGVAAAEEGCPNEALRQVETSAHPEGFATRLPDCRAYEQVTPVDKNGGNASGFPNGVQASPSGDGIVFPVLADMPGDSSGLVDALFLGSRDGEGWSQQGLQVPHGPRGFDFVSGWSEDLSRAAVYTSEATPGAGHGVYLRDTTAGSFQLALPFPPAGEIFPVGFSADDSRMFFETEAQLLPSAAAGVDNLYEWHGGVVSLVGVLPDGSTPSGGSFAGPYDWYRGDTTTGGARREYYLEEEHAISRDGSRVFFTAGGTEHIYVRENGTSTVPVGVGAFVAATPDGSKVVYLAGGELFEFDLESAQSTDLTPAGGVQGVLGVGEDGSYVYFAANGNLYVWHDGTISFIAEAVNQENWAPRIPPFSTRRGKISRVTPDGRVLLFAGAGGFYRYQAVNGRLACVTCNPNGESSEARLESIDEIVGAALPAILLHNLSADGGRVFFDSPDALVPQDTNGVQDVYEWEQRGIGDCQGFSETFSPASGGCLYLISTGTSPDKSYLADASASGDDVFFYTDQPLVGRDQDGLVDIYDARAGGGFAAQNPPAAPAPCEGEACKTPPGGASVFGVPVSATFSGAGNLVPPPPVAAAPKPKHRAAAPKHKRKPKRKRKAGKAGRGALSAGARRAMRGGK